VRIHPGVGVVAGVLVFALPAAAKEVEIKGFGTTPPALRKQIRADLEAHARRELEREQLLARFVEYGDPALPYLGKLLQEEDTRRARGPLLRHLPRISPDKGERLLVTLSRSSSPPHLPQAVAQTLGHVGTARSLDALLPLLDHDVSSIRSTAAEAVLMVWRREYKQKVDGVFAPPEPNVQTRIVERARVLLVKGVKSPRHQEVGTLALYLLVRTLGIRALNDVQLALGAPHLKPDALALFPEFTSRGNRLELDEFSSYDLERLHDVLVQVLRFPDFGLSPAELLQRQKSALSGLAMIGDISHVGTILEWLDEDVPEEEAPGVLRHATTALKRLSGEDHADLDAWRRYWKEIEEILRDYELYVEQVKEGQEQEAVAALSEIAKVRDARTFEAIAWVLDLDERETPETIGLAACGALARLRDPRGIPPLVKLLDTRLASPGLKERAAWALGLISGRPGPADPAHWKAVYPFTKTPEDLERERLAAEAAAEVEQATLDE